MLKIHVAPVKKGAYGRVQDTKIVSWESVIEVLSKYEQSEHTLEEYWALKNSLKSAPDVAPIPKHLRDEARLKATRMKDVGGAVYAEMSGNERNTANVVSKSLLVLDIDSTQKTYAQLRAAVIKLGYECFMHSSFAHTFEKPRVRLIIKTSRNTTPDEYVELFNVFMKSHGHVIDGVDPMSRDVAHFFFKPCVPAGREFVCEHFKGDVLAVDNYVLGFGVAEFDATPREPEVIDKALSDLDIDFANDSLDLEAELTRGDVEAMLYKIDPSTDYKSWLMIGQALHNWSPTLGLDVWEAWSQHGDNYEVGVTEDKWASFSSERQGVVTIGTIHHLAARADLDSSERIVAEIRTDIQRCTSIKDVLADVAPRVRKSLLPPMYAEQLVQFTKTHMFQQGVKLSVADVRDAFSPNSRGLVTSDAIVPQWCRNWVYVRAEEAFFDTHHRKATSAKAFNIMNDHRLPSDAKSRAEAWVAKHNTVRVIEKSMFIPSVDNAVIDVDGETVFNLYNPRQRPVERFAEEYDDEDRRAIALIEFHVRALFSEHYPEGADIFLDWLAFQVQFPGHLLRWCPLLISPAQGLGKTILRSVLKAVLGHNYVGGVSKDVVASDFTGYAEGKCVNVIEEIRPNTTGSSAHSRYEIYEKLKEIITNDDIHVHRKGIDGYDAPNVTNYLAFANKMDAIPLDKSDRRFWVHIIGFNDALQFEEMLTGLARMQGLIKDDEHYFQAIVDVCQSKRLGEALRGWLLRRKISPLVRDGRRAPPSAAKDKMIATEEASNKGDTQVLQEVVASGGVGVSAKVLSVPHFKQLVKELGVTDTIDADFKDFADSHLDSHDDHDHDDHDHDDHDHGSQPKFVSGSVDGRMLSDRMIGRTLKDMGFLRTDKPIRWDDGSGQSKLYRVWVSASMAGSSHGKIIEELNSTLAEIF